MRILFAGTPEFAVPSLKQLYNLTQGSGHEIVGVLSAPARPSGRGRKLQPSPVAESATVLGLRVFTPARLLREARQEIAGIEPDLLVVVAYGRLFGPKFLSLFTLGGINLHPSLLPRHRGPAPIPAAVLSGDAETGLTVQRLALEMDAGDILLQERRTLYGNETAGDIYPWAGERGALLMRDAVDGMAEGALHGTPQDHSRATYCSLLRKSDGEIDWQQPGEHIDRQVRAYNPYPGAFTALDGHKLTLWRSSGVFPGNPGASPGTVLKIDKNAGILVQTGTQALGVTQLQLAHKKSLDWKSFCNGMGDPTGRVFGGRS